MKSPPVPRRSRYAILAALALCLLPLACVARPETITRDVAKGVTLTEEITTGDTPQLIHVLTVDLKAPGVKVKCGQAQDAITLNGPTKGREQIHSLATRNGAIAAINADFFPYTGDPLGLAIRDGELLSEPMEYRACLGFGPSGVLMDILVPIGSLFTPDNAITALDGINRVPHDGEIVALTPAYAATPHLDTPCAVITLQNVNLPVKVSQDAKGVVTSVALLAPNDPLPACSAGNVLMVAAGRATDTLSGHCKIGDSVRFRFDLTTNAPTPMRGRFPSRAGSLRGRAFKTYWSDIEQAVGGGPVLLRDGQIALDAEAENFSTVQFVEKRHPRTAAGVTADGKLLLVTVDGRQTWSKGVSLPELAQIMKRLGAVNAINLDGGGSTTLFVGGGVVNSPSDGRERAVANALLLYATLPDVPNADALQIRPNKPNGLEIKVGEPLQLSLTDADGNTTDAAKSVLWGTGDGLGFINQKGVFTSFVAGSGSIVARIGNRQIVTPLRVLPGDAALIKATLTPSPDNPTVSDILTVTVRDKFGNPLAGQPVGVELKGGELDSPLVTDARGIARSAILWEAPSGQRSVKVSSGSASPTVFRR